MTRKYLISLIECVYAFWGNIYINVPTVEILAFSATSCLQMDYSKTVRLSKHFLITSGFTFFLTFFTLFHKKGKNYTANLYNGYKLKRITFIKFS